MENKTMKALVKTGKGRESVRLLDVPIPTPGDGEVLIKVMACGICGTDEHIMHDAYLHTIPVILGHEFTGIVTKTGPNVDNLAVGDQVVALSAQKSCGGCKYCRMGDYVHCTQKKSIGIDLGGGMAEYIVTTARRTFKVPDSFIGKDILAITEPLACCVRAVLEKSHIHAGDVVVVSGPGVIGLLCMQLAKLCGAFVIVTGTPADKARLELAKRLGADVVNEEPSRVLDIVQAYAPDGADHVLECSGAAPSLKTALECVRKEGSLTQVGMYGKNVDVPMDTVVRKELKITAGFSQAMSTWELALKIIGQDVLKLEELVSARMRLEDWEKAFDLFESKTENKIFLIP